MYVYMCICMYICVYIYIYIYICVYMSGECVFIESVHITVKY